MGIPLLRGLFLTSLLLLAGCSDKPDDDLQGQGDGLGADIGNTTTPPLLPTGGAGNLPPVATLTVFSTNGSAPFEAVFQVGGTDADGDALTWRLDAGDGTTAVNGTTLPTNVTHVFAVEGVYNVTLNVTDGTEIATAYLVITTLPGGVVPTQDYAAAWTAGTLVVGRFGDLFLSLAAYPSQADGALFDSFAINPLTIGQPWVATASTSGVADSPGFTFLDAAGDIVQAGFELSGIIPEGAATGVFWVCAGGPMTGTYHAGP